MVQILGMLYSETGECAELFRNHAWNTTSLGEPETWPVELQTLASIVLRAKQPMCVVWGAQRIAIYNDACAAIYGSRHPQAFGESINAIWSPAMRRQMELYIAAAYRGISSIERGAPLFAPLNDDAEEAQLSFSYTPVYAAGCVEGVLCCGNALSKRHTIQKQNENERQLLKTLFEKSLGAVAVVEGPNYIITYANEEYKQLIGHRDIINRPVHDALPEIAAQGYLPLLEEVYATGKPHIGKAVEVTLQRVPHGGFENRIVDFVYHPIFKGDGPCEGVFVQVIDITEQHLHQRELAHRLKNQLAAVQSMVSLTLRSGKNLNDAMTVLKERIAVLARSQDVVISGNANHRSVEAVIRNAIAWQPGDHIHISGEPLIIGSRQALSLALIMHELLTNALKYGALSTHVGKVDIRWHIEQDNDTKRFVLDWIETGGPPVMQPQHKGVGTRLIEAGLSGAINTKAIVHFEPSGLHYELSTDLAHLHNDD